MKNRMLKWIKRTISAVAIVALMGGTIITVEAREDESPADSTVKYVEYTSYAEYKVDNTEDKLVPEYSEAGYVFGGWFTKAGDKYSPIAKMSTQEGTIYAKFVPASVLSVKCQNIAGTTEGSQDTTMKVVSALDTLNYQSYGFEMDVIKLNAENTYAGQTEIQYKYDLKNAYTAFNVYKDAEGTELAYRYTPNQLFGKAAQYFTTHGVKTIPNGSFGAIVCIKPYWKTIDGTEVYGLTKYAHVEDGFVKEGYRYVNVPVNLREVANGGVAAGVLNVNYDKNTFILDKVEGGRYFEEMAWADKGTSVKMVGNLTNISTDKNVDDIYANIRFKVSESDAYKVLTGYTFTVDGEDFSNSAETQTTPDVWNVLY